MTATTSAEKIRILYCEDCRTLEELPDYDGPPEHDTLLEILISRHETPSGLRHVGKLFDVEVRLWSDTKVRHQIIDQIKGGGSKGLAEFDSSFYDTRSTFYADALQCYSQHLRPKGACPDWMADSKILLPDTKAERKEEGLDAPAKAPGPKVHLCQFCPVQRYYVNKVNDARHDL